jgi:DNA-binding GntR family transcriptional regulator
MTIAAATAPKVVRIVEVLREQITRGDIADGAPLRQEAIAEQFGVSHIPVREALRQLVSEGLAEQIHNRGVVVSSLSADVAWELTEYRALLEGQMIRWSVPNLTIGDLQTATSVLAKIERTTDAVEILRLNVEFHEILYRPANRPYFSEEIRRARGKLVRYWRLAREDREHQPRTHHNHRSIVELCRYGHAEQAAEEMELHILETGRLVVDYLRKRS